MPVIKPTTVPTKVLAESINASASSFKLNNINGWDGEALVSGDFGDPLYVIFRDAKNSKVELMEIDPATIANSSITISKRGLQFDGNLTTEVSANKLSWNKGDTFVDLGTDTPQLWQWLKEYIDTASIAGAVPAANVTAGIIKIATATELDADTEDDGTYDYVPNPATLAASKYGTRLPSSDEKAALAGGGDFGTPSTSNKFLTEDWIDAKAPQVVTFTTSGTWTKDAGLKYVVVELVGGGGKGGSANTSSQGGGGGGAGGYSRKLIDAASLGATETVTIGAGSTGSGGGTTSFGSHCSATGGSDGEAYNAGADGGAGGVGSNGDINSYGNGGGAGASTAGNGGVGGGSYFGGGARGVDSEVGSAGAVYGGGGSGANNANSQGGNGAAGLVVVTEYYS